MRTIKKNIHAAHKRLYYWCAENPDKDKRDWPEWSYWETLESAAQDNPNTAFNHCFACAAAIYDCTNCPIDWNSLRIVPCLSLNSFYQKYRNSTNAKNKSALARVMAELPWNGPKIITFKILD